MPAVKISPVRGCDKVTETTETGGGVVVVELPLLELLLSPVLEPVLLVVLPPPPPPQAASRQARVSAASRWHVGWVRGYVACGRS